MKLRSKEEFNNLVEPLKEINLSLEKSKDLFDSHKERVFEMCKEERDMTDKQVETYNDLYYKMLINTCDLIENMKQFHFELVELKKDYEKNHNYNKND